ncbi:DDE-type integrase/transposase/recombinase [Streptomyces sp. NPDC048484]|uniref:DDE-type integrase/transposase/recombinase n=1 Tax=Streptomyces sp. NPDC048484 TaxID=3155146 RepID=UPI00343AE9CF
MNTKYVGDITYLPVNGAKPLYLATVIDLASRRLAGRAIADHMRTELVIDALAAAERTRGSLEGAIMHTDHGSQYGAVPDARPAPAGSCSWTLSRAAATAAAPLIRPRRRPHASPGSSSPGHRGRARRALR